MKKLSIAILALVMSSAAFATPLGKNFTVVDNQGQFRLLATPKIITLEQANRPGAQKFQVKRIIQQANAVRYDTKMGKSKAVVKVSNKVCRHDKTALVATLTVGNKVSQACAYKGLIPAH